MTCRRRSKKAIQRRHISSALATIWSKSAGLVGITPADYPELWLHRVAAAGIDTSGVVSSSETGLASEWFFHRADGGRVDHLHGDADVFEAFFSFFSFFFFIIPYDPIMNL